MSLRSIIIGITLVCIVVLAAPYSIWMVHSSELTWSYFPTSVGFCFIILILFNIAFRKIFPGNELQPRELVLILVMGLAATGIPTFIAGTTLAILSNPPSNGDRNQMNFHPRVADCQSSNHYASCRTAHA